jgi:hypothetical protein
MSDWNLWLNSRETRTAIRLLNETREEIREAITDGFTQEKSIEKISLDYTYALGQLEGIQIAMQTLKDIKALLDEEKDDDK